jgi:hypothetical protein
MSWACLREGYAMQEYPPQPKDEYWQPSEWHPSSTRNIPQYQPPKKQKTKQKPKKRRTACIVFSLCSVVAIVITLAPGISILTDGLVIAFVLILNLLVWLKS